MAEPQSIDYAAVLADLEAKRAQLDNAIAVIKAMLGQPLTEGGAPAGAGLGPPGGALRGPPAPDAYLGLSIPEATRKHLAAIRTRVPTRDLMTALQQGGLPPASYNTVYGVLRRRESQVGDIINMNGDWALAEWYPNHAKPKKGAKTDTDDSATKAKEKDSTKEAPRAHKDVKEVKEVKDSKDAKVANN